MPRGDDRLPKIVCGLDFYISGRKIDRFYVSLQYLIPKGILGYVVVLGWDALCCLQTLFN